MNSELKDLSKKFLIPTIFVLEIVTNYFIGFGIGFVAMEQDHPREDIENIIRMSAPIIREAFDRIYRMAA